MNLIVVVGVCGYESGPLRDLYGGVRVLHLRARDAAVRELLKRIGQSRRYDAHENMIACFAYR